MPPAAGMPVAVVGTHARALAIVALGIPAGLGALLLLLVELDHVGLAVPLQRLVDEPGSPTTSCREPTSVDAGCYPAAKPDCRPHRACGRKSACPCRGGR